MTSETKDDGGNAFPWGEHGTRIGGMSLRDWFAGQALGTAYCNETTADADKVAEWAYQIADAMLAARVIGEPE